MSTKNLGIMNTWTIGGASCILIIALAMTGCQRKATDNISSQTVLQEVLLPVITLEQDSIQLGKIRKGAKVPMEYTFTNTGNTDLLIEIVTTCKCTEITWPTEAVPPGGKGKISAVYDTTQEKLGPVRKTLDIIANTDPLLMEASFFAEIIE